MKYFHLYLILFFVIAFVRTLRPKNIRIFDTEDKNGKLSYEHTIFKDETFAIQFIRGELYRWKHSNDSLSKEKSLLYF